jgi:predicted cobalt transporter CbtA
MGKIYFLKSGAASALAGLTLFLLYYKFGIWYLSYFALPGYVGLLTVDYVSGCQYPELLNTSIRNPVYCESLELSGIILSTVILYFAVGLVVGWVFRKLRNKC